MKNSAAAPRAALCPRPPKIDTKERSKDYFFVILSAAKNLSFKAAEILHSLRSVQNDRSIHSFLTATSYNLPEAPGPILRKSSPNPEADSGFFPVKLGKSLIVRLRRRE